MPIGNRAHETSTTAGTGTIDLNGAVAGKQVLVAAMEENDPGGGPYQVDYLITDGTDWEAGTGTLTDASPDTLARDTVHESTNGNSQVNWGGGTRDVFLDVPADVLFALFDHTKTGFLRKTAARVFSWIAHPLPVADGGTASTTAAAARSALDAMQQVLTTRGDLLYRNATVPARLAKGTLGQRVTQGADDPEWADVVQEARPNLLVNGCCRVWQRGPDITAAGTYTNADDSYVLDHVVLLSDGDDIVDVAQETSVVPTGAHSAIKATIVTANKKFGFLFPLEAKDAAAIIGGTASVSFEARHGTVARKMRAVLLAWDGTADAITSDVVSVWGVEGIEPTWAANWTREGSAPSDLVLSTSYQTFTVEGVSIDTASAANVALFIWNDEDDASAAELFYISEVKVEKGALATAFVARPYVTEKELCKRYFRTSFQDGVAPVQNVGDFLGALSIWSTSSNSDGARFELSPRMFATPTITTYNWGNTNSSFRDDGTNDATANIRGQGEAGFSVYIVSAQADALSYGHFTAEAEL